jgi:hypothetical protein
MVLGGDKSLFVGGRGYLWMFEDRLEDVGYGFVDGENVVVLGLYGL